jgi:hypothetical protein
MSLLLSVANKPFMLSVVYSLKLDRFMALGVIFLYNKTK